MPSPSAQSPLDNLTLFGMSGLGKTHIAKMLRFDGDWFHYSIDYRIATRYMGALIEDDLKRQAMTVPALRALLMSDSITVKSKVSFENLAPLSAYLGKPGDPGKDGLAIETYMERQKEHHRAEAQALLDTHYFQKRAQALYGHARFVCDTGGSICEIVDPHDPNDPILTHLQAHTTLVWIKGSEDHLDMLVERFNKAPKPMCYPTDYLMQKWAAYLTQHDAQAHEVDPDHFVRWIYADAIKARHPKYKAMADLWGITICADALKECKTVPHFLELVKSQQNT